MSDSQFKSVYKDDLADYLAISEGTIGVEALRNTHSILQSFDSLLTEEDTIEISEEVINRWIEALTKINSPKTVSDKVSYLRKFLRYLQYKGYSVFMPACPKTTDDYIPYIFSEEEIQLLLACADNLAARLTNSKSRQTAIEFCMLLRMLIGCGFRRGELLAAKVKDVNFSQGTILIRHAKNNKQRIVPMNYALADMLERYCIALGIKMEHDSFLFPSSRKREQQPADQPSACTSESS